MKARYSVEQFTPLNDNVIVKPIKITNMGQYVRPQGDEDRSELGEIISMGTAASEYLKVGDIVLYNKYSTVKTDLGEELVVRSEDIVAVLKK